MAIECSILFTDYGFLLKLLALILDIVSYVWTLVDDCGNGMQGEYGHILYNFTVPAYIIILTTFMVVYICDVAPLQIEILIYGAIGTLLFLATGLCVLLNTINGSGYWGLYAMSVCHLVIAAVLLFDCVLSIQADNPW